MTFLKKTYILKEGIDFNKRQIRINKENNKFEEENNMGLCITDYKFIKDNKELITKTEEDSKECKKDIKSYKGII